MNNKKADFKNAESEAIKIIQKNYITSPPVSLAEIAEEEGLNIAIAEFAEKDISGFIDFEKKLVIVNKFDSSTRQRFTIAHELGHWILHPNELQNNRDIVIFYRRSIEKETDPLEQEANCFAANLLVPLSFLQKNYNMSNKDLANLFNVSEAVIKFRRGFLDKQ